MPFWKKLFGGGNAQKGGKPAAEATYQGYSITATPMPEGGQYRLCGLITKTIDGEVKEHKLIRADVFPSLEETAQATIRKARHLIDEQGDSLFG